MKSLRTSIVRLIRNKRFNLTIVALGAVLWAGCQDHHWKSYDEVEEHPEIMTQQKGPVPLAPPLESKGTADMLGEYRSDKTKVLVSGKVQLDPSAVDADYSGWVLYVIARPAVGRSLLAAVKVTDVTFPYEFSIMPKDIMFGEPKQGITYNVSARFDSDGDLDTKDAVDLFGDHEGGSLPRGSKDALVTIKKGAS